MHMPCTCHAHTDHAHRMLMVHGFFDSNPTAKQAPQWHNACGFKTGQCNETPNALKPFKTVFFSTGCANVMAMCNNIVKRSLLPKEVSLRWPCTYNVYRGKTTHKVLIDKRCGYALAVAICVRPIVFGAHMYRLSIAWGTHRCGPTTCVM